MWKIGSQPIREEIQGRTAIPNKLDLAIETENNIIELFSFPNPPNKNQQTEATA